MKKGAKEERHKKVFEALEDCVQEARLAQSTNDWSVAKRKSCALRRLVNAVRAAEGVAHSIAFVAGIIRQDPVLVVVSAATLASLGIAVYIHRSRKK